MCGVRMIVGSAVWALVSQSDIATWIILAVLLVMSIMSWTIAVQKWLLLRYKITQADSILERMKSCTTLDELHELALSDAQQTGGMCMLRGVRMVRSLLGRENTLYDDVLLVRDELEAGIQAMMSEVESNLLFLRVAAEASPLLGLLGTIWGLIHSFVRISHTNSADIATVAPGIAEALITTMMGLLVAIPALLFFHAVARYMYVYEMRLLQMVEHVERVARACFLNQGSSNGSV